MEKSITGFLLFHVDYVSFPSHCIELTIVLRNRKGFLRSQDPDPLPFNSVLKIPAGLPFSDPHLAKYWNLIPLTGFPLLGMKGGVLLLN